MTITAVRPGMRAAHALTSPFTPIGHTPGGQPVYPAQGGRSGGGVQFAVGDDEGDDPEFDDQDDGDEDDEDEAPAARTRTGRRTRDDADDDEAEWTPPDRESFDRLTAALKRANAEAGKRRRVGKVMERLGITDLETFFTERGIDPTTGQPYGDDVIGTGDDGAAGRGLDDYEREPEPDERPRESERDRRQRDKDIARKMLAAEQRGKATARDEMMPILAEQAARLALRDAGFTGDARRLDRVLRMIDPGSLDLDMDDSGFELVGIDEAIGEIREEFPEFFEDRTPARRRPVAATTGRARTSARDVDGGDRGRPAKKVGSWKDQISAQLVNRGRA